MRLSVCAAMLSALCAACDSDPSGEPADGLEPPPNDAGPTGCAPGELAVEGGCRPAGIAPEACAEGFEPTEDRSCAAVLPEGVCPEGTFAIPGETRCHEVAPCGRGKFGDIRGELDTQYVDGSYTAGDSDGSSEKPWSTIGNAVAAAAFGAIVAVAEGSYPEDVILSGKRVRLWGSCPGRVEIVGTGVENGAVTVGPGADGSEVHTLALTGALNGVFVDGAEDVLVRAVWIHDTGDRGVGVQDTLGLTSVIMEDSLVERATGAGIVAIGVPIELEGCAIRNTLPRSDGIGGRGINAFGNPNNLGRATLTLRRSLIEASLDVGVRVAGSDVTIEGSVLRDTAPSESGSYGSGLYVIPDPDTHQASTASVRGSVFERNHHVGIMVDGGSEATIETTVVRDTGGHLATGKQGAAGLGINVLAAALTLRSSVVERNRKIGVFVSGSAGVLEGVIVRDTREQEADGIAGRGVNVQLDPESGARASLALSGSVIERSHEMGLFIAGSDVTVDSIRISDVAPQSSDLRFGRGIDVQHDSYLGQPSSLSMRNSRVERTHDVGVFVSVPGVAIESTVIAETLQQQSDGAFGDGLGVFSVAGPASARLSDCRVERSARAGVATFGAQVTLANTTLECNAIALNGEPVGEAKPEIVDEAGNVCGCEGTTETCRMQSAGLAPPEAGDLSD